MLNIKQNSDRATGESHTMGELSSEFKQIPCKDRQSRTASSLSSRPAMNQSIIACLILSVTLCSMCGASRPEPHRDSTNSQHSNLTAGPLNLVASKKVISSMSIDQKISSKSLANGLNKTATSDHQTKASAPIVSLSPASSTNSSKVFVKNSSAPDQQAAASILRPLILRRLISGRTSKLLGAGSAAPEPAEEEEEVTQTIMMPMTGQTEVPTAAQVASAINGDVEEGDSVEGGIGKIREIRESDDSTSTISKAIETASADTKLQHDELPKAEESLQLTSTEMSSLLNDREAPEFYRERERHGDGVLVREEQPVRLTTAASGGFGSHHHHLGSGGWGGGSLGVGHPLDTDSYAHHRLSHAASEGFSDRGFSHRFGAPAHGYADELGGHGGGRLMQSPNEYNEYHSHGPAMAGNYEAGHGYGYGPESHGSHDYSGHSGLLRAGSGDYGHDHSHAVGYDGYAPHDGHGAMGGYMGGAGHGRLEQHSSELYPGGHGGYGHAQGHLGDHMGGLYGGGRLHSAGSHHAGGYPGAHFTDDSYSSRYGHAGAGFERRGFATQSTGVVMRDSSSMGASASGTSGEGTTTKLVPLTPVVPAPEEVSSSEAVEKEASRPQQQVHEALDEDALNSNHHEEDSAEDTNTAQGSSYNYGGTATAYGSASGGSGAGEDNVGGSQARLAKQESSGDGEPSLVLNVPPPSGDSSQAYRSSSQVEFARVGSAGYLPPNLVSSSQSSSSAASSSGDAEENQEYEERKVQKKSSPAELRDQPASYDPADNPAHVGKYIID